jgi:hypothetical protein
MFGLGSFQQSKWGWDFYKYPGLYGVTNYIPSTVGHFTSPTLAPNGISYLLPTFNFLSDNTTQFNEVIALKPGKSNNNTSKWEVSTIHRIPSDTGGKHPNLPNPLEITASSQKRFFGRGVLAPNGEIYFMGFRAKGIVALKPQSDPSLDPAAGNNTVWRVTDFSTATINNGTNVGFCGGVLHSDGHIYMIPNPIGTVTNISVNPTQAQQVVRIKPRTTSINSSSLDIYEKSYYDGTTLAKSFNSATGPYLTPRDSSNNTITASDTTQVLDTNWDSYSIVDAVSHPNGKIYMFGGISRYVFILDPNNWSQQNCVYTDYDLRIPTDLTSLSDYGIDGVKKGLFMGASLEKLTPGQDPSTLKIILHFEGIVNTTTTPVTNKYMRTLILDPVTNTITAAGDWYKAASTNSFSFQTSFPIKLPNGFTYNFAGFPGSVGVGAQYTYSGNTAGEITVKGPLTTTVGSEIIYNDDLTPLKTKGGFMNYIKSSLVSSSYFNNGANVVNQGEALGKSIFGSLEGGGELVSVKGYHPGIKYFDYDTTTDDTVYKIPNNISSDLKTSLWNSYFNKPL